MALAVALGLPAVASAGVFGGFGKSGTYLRGTDQVCRAVEGARDVPRCKKISAAEVAKRRFASGARQRGAGAEVDARASGSRIEIVPAGGGEPLATWDAGSAVKVSAVYLSAKKDAVAVEYVTRFGGRSIEDVVVLELGDALRARAGAAAASVATGERAAGAPPAPPAPAEPEETPAVAAALQKTRRAAAKKRWDRVARFAGEALAGDESHPEARFWLAAAKAARKDGAGATALLADIAASKRKWAIAWLVEARLHPAFRGLRADPGFRRAVGLAADPKRPPGAYERLVGYGGEWEQPAIPCEQARANLSLHTEPSKGEAGQRFELVIRSRCRGTRETTRLDGTWRAAGTDVLELRFPNQQGPAEGLQCSLEACADSSGEDCLRCRPDPQLELLFRIVRR